MFFSSILQLSRALKKLSRMLKLSETAIHFIIYMFTYYKLRFCVRSNGFCSKKQIFSVFVSRYGPDDRLRLVHGSGTRIQRRPERQT